ncbi:MAG: SDR family oxidoreductase [Candidatus Rokubacteria bacterium]|nr:SDR family oxidoreductase [Candidatus Rokubacteria bacterium]
MRRLEGKVALVTGAGSGIGRVAALMLAAEGAAIAIAGRRKEPLDAVVKEIEQACGTAAARACDVSKQAEARALGTWAEETFGRVDILVNNAGHSSTVRAVRWVTDDDWNAVVNVNLNGVYALTQTVIHGMLARGDGNIITVSSIAGIRPGLLGGSPYSAAKAGVRNFMGSVLGEFRQHGIRATTIIPGEVDTPILDRRPLNPDAKARTTMMMPEDVAAAILLCATLPPRAVVEEIVMTATHMRDVSQDLEVARRLGEPGYTPPR